MGDEVLEYEEVIDYQSEGKTPLNPKLIVKVLIKQNLIQEFMGKLSRIARGISIFSIS